MPNVTEELRTALIDRYVIESELGEGGMATVYLAHDVKHNRKVALKVLKPELAAMIGAERFLKEIEVTANLQHPNILPLHDSGESSGFLYYVMPYVEGETLRAKLEREKQFSIDEAVELTRAIAGALDYAHRQGVIHRDIKPENILLLEGQPEVADFGIALAVSQAGGTRLTETGLSIGTPQYMSPEQAMGDRELDARSDIYSLGAMLYEMLTGDPPYMGSTAQAIVAKVITEHAPSVSLSRDTVPPHVAASVDKALAKLPADRFSSAAQFAEALVTPGFTGLTVDAAASAGLARTNRTTMVAVGAAVVLALLLVGSLVTRPSAPAPSVSRQRIVLMSDPLVLGAVIYGVALAPDGSAIVFSDTVGGERQLWLKERDQELAAPIAGTLGGRYPFYAPDGSWVAFFADNRLKKVSPRGGSSITLADSATGLSRGGAWLDDGTIVFNHRWGLMRVGEDGGEVARLLAEGDTAISQRLVAGSIQPLPKGRGVLIVGCSDSSCAESEVYVFDLETGEAKLLVEEAGAAWHTPTGHLLYVRRDGGVFAAPFDLETLTLTAAGLPVLDGLRTTNFNLAEMQLGLDGTLMYLKGGDTNRDNGEVVWVDRRGGIEPVDPEWTIRAGNGAGVSISPDGSRLAVGIADNGTHLWIKQLDRGPLTRLTFDGTINTRAQWMPDGTALRFISNRGDGEGVWYKRADGSAQAEEVLDLEEDIWELVLSSDGNLAVIRTGGSDGGRDLHLVGSGDSSTVTLLSGSFDEMSPTLSPDGRFMAYVSDESGRNEVYVRPFPDAGASRWQVSKNGGREPLWAHSGKELFYIGADGNMVAAQVTTEPTFGVDSEEILFSVGSAYFTDAVHRYYDVSADDQRFIMIRRLLSGDRSEQPDLILVENWFVELEQLVGSE